jgi:asparagine synthase (glutamine-hydrolysing)
MCGFAGIFSSANADRPQLLDLVARMAETLAHRGPDDRGTWADAEEGIAFGFRRLAIVELSDLGHQPMCSRTGRYTLVFNGEVYNHLELRRELQGSGVEFRGCSDTETILAAFEHWGILPAVRRFMGMFAIALWDAHERRLHLIRDRLGVKPLFVHSKDGVVSFASELKALAACPSFDRSLDRDALTLYLRHLYVPAPLTIYEHARKVLPGHVLTIARPSQALPEPVPYWSLEEVARAGVEHPYEGSEDEAIEALDELLRSSVRLRMLADVPIGALLSGGIDSSAVVSILQEISARPVRTFSIGFDAKEHDETTHAAAVAAHLGTDHTEVLLTGKDALSVVPALPDLFDEPHADTSQIPAYLICAAARRQITVALSGDGGDEVFGGYNRYTHGERLLQKLSRIPAPARRLAAIGISRISQDSWNRAHRAITPVLPPQYRHRLPGEKIHKLSRMLGAGSPAQMYRSVTSAWQRPEEVVIGGGSAFSRFDTLLERRGADSFLDRAMLADQASYLPDDQLAKVDRVSMAVGLEVRVPLVDHRVVEFAWRLPDTLKVRGDEGKWILRQVLFRRVPQHLVDRPKMGLSVPLGAWLRGPLRGWAEDLLDEERIGRAGILAAAPIRRRWCQLLAGHDQGALALWAVLVFQAWQARWLP